MSSELIEHTETTPALPVEASTSVTPMELLRMATAQGADVDTLGKFMELQQRWEANEARKMYNAAFIAFKREVLSVVRNITYTDGPLKGKKYADKWAIVSAVTPHLAKHELAASWTCPKDEKDWIEISCVLRHVNGHSEAVTLGGPPDIGPARNALQARISTKSYLEKETLKAICGLAEKHDDDDGRQGRTGMSEGIKADWLAAIEALEEIATSEKTWKEIAAACSVAGDVAAYEELKAAMSRKVRALRAGKKEEGIV